MKQKIRKLHKSIRYASQGLRHTFMTQQNMVIHFVVAVIIVGCGILCGFSPEKHAILLLTIALVMILEIVNTVAETLVDLVSPEYSELGKIAKDIAAGAVLLAAFFAVVIGMLLFIPEIVTMLT